MNDLRREPMADQEGSVYLRRTEQTDVAVLAAGSIAVVIALFINPGPWDITGLIPAQHSAARPMQ